MSSAQQPNAQVEPDAIRISIPGPAIQASIPPTVVNRTPGIVAGNAN